MVNTTILVVKQYIHATKCPGKGIAFVGALTKLTEFEKFEKLVTHRKHEQNAFKNGRHLLSHILIYSMYSKVCLDEMLHLLINVR